MNGFKVLRPARLHLTRTTHITPKTAAANCWAAQIQGKLEMGPPSAWAHATVLARVRRPAEHVPMCKDHDRQPTFLRKRVHQAVVNVDEEGTEAATIIFGSYNVLGRHQAMSSSPTIPSLSS